MGFFDSIKNALGGGDDESEGIKGPSMVLREAGIDPSDLKFDFSADGTVTVKGHVQDAGARDRIADLIGGIPNVSNVVNEVQIGAPPAPEPEVVAASDAPQPSAADISPGPVGNVDAAADSGTVSESIEAPEAAEGGKTYTVQPGDSLWKIASAELGSGARYTEIFEANRDILDNPDLIKPGQVLKIPE